MLGPVVNAVAILVGGLIGLLLRGGIKEKYKTIVTQAVALCVIAIGLSGTIGKMLEPDANSILFIISLVIGSLVGEWIGIEAKIQKLGDWVQGKVKLKKDYGDISTGFVTTSLLFCVGTMAILGSIESGAQNNHTILFAKSVLDGVTALIMASSLGVGVLLSAVSVLAYEGVITLLASVISPYLTTAMLNDISIIGGIMIAVMGLNLLGVTKVKVANMLPAIVVPVIYYTIIGLF